MTLPSVPPAGNPEARYWILKGMPSPDDLWKRSPLGGRAGDEFARMLHDAGLLVSESYALCASETTLPGIQWTSKKAEAKDNSLPHFEDGYYFSDGVKQIRDSLRARIAAYAPEIIIAIDDFSLWCLVGETNLSNWRGSYLQISRELRTVVVPTYSAAQIFRVWEWRVLAVEDLRRVKRYLDNPAAYQPPNYNFAIRPSLPGVLQTLRYLEHLCDKGPTLIACDIETICRHISCIGVAWSATEALCIPLLAEFGESYWNLDEEIAVQLALRKVLTHPNARIVGQNFNYDNQHFAKHLGYLPNLTFDTMIAHHVLFPGTPKDLAMLSSLYCHYHRYWKDELKDYNKMPNDIHQYWTYNCKDCVITWEIATVLKPILKSEGLYEQFQFLMDLARDVLFTMLRGIAINQKARSQVAGELMRAIEDRKAAINQIVGQEFNVGSPKQMQTLFYEDMGLPVQVNRKTKRPSCDDVALKALVKHQPLLAPFVELIAETRSLGVFLSTFCLMPLDSDSRMRTMFNVAGSETFRFSSSENAFGNGGNLQNIPVGEKD